MLARLDEFLESQDILFAPILFIIYAFHWVLGYLGAFLFLPAEWRGR